MWPTHGPATADCPQARGTGDLLVAVVDGLKGFPEAITTVYPECIVQTCIVHLIRYSLQFASWKERKPLAKAQFAIQFGDRFVLTV